MQEYIYAPDSETMGIILNNVVDMIALIPESYIGTIHVTDFLPVQPNEAGFDSDNGVFFNYSQMLAALPAPAQGVAETIKFLILGITVMAPQCDFALIPAPLQDTCSIKHITTDTPEVYGFFEPDPDYDPPLE